MGGEHILSRSELRFDSGSSPRGRGTQLGIKEEEVLVRIIPAWAGNTSALQVTLY